MAKMLANTLHPLPRFPLVILDTTLWLALSSLAKSAWLRSPCFCLSALGKLSMMSFDSYIKLHNHYTPFYDVCQAFYVESTLKNSELVQIHYAKKQKLLYNKGNRGEHFMTNIFVRVKALREQKGWTQTDLAERSGVDQANISRLEAGKTPNVSAVLLGQLATALDTTIDYLIGRTDNPAPYHADLPHPALADPRLRFIVDLWPLEVGGVDFVTDIFKTAIFHVMEAYEEDRMAALKRAGIVKDGTK